MRLEGGINSYTPLIIFFLFLISHVAISSFSPTEELDIICLNSSEGVASSFRHNMLDEDNAFFQCNLL